MAALCRIYAFWTLFRRQKTFHTGAGRSVPSPWLVAENWGETDATRKRKAEVWHAGGAVTVPLLGASVPRTLCILGGCWYWILQQELVGYCPDSECSLPSRCLQQVWGGKHRFGRDVLAQQCLCESLVAEQLDGTCCRTPSSTLAAGMTLCSGQASCASGRVAMSQCCVAFIQGTDDGVPSWSSTQVPG